MGLNGQFWLVRASSCISNTSGKFPCPEPTYEFQEMDAVLFCFLFVFCVRLHLTESALTPLTAHGPDGIPGIKLRSAACRAQTYPLHFYLYLKSFFSPVIRGLMTLLRMIIAGLEREYSV